MGSVLAAIFGNSTAHARKERADHLGSAPRFCLKGFASSELTRTKMPEGTVRAYCKNRGLVLCCLEETNVGFSIQVQAMDFDRFQCKSS